MENKMSQEIHRFDNGYGASVIQKSFSYGAAKGLFELAVIKFTGDDWNLDYSTPITNDVIGHLTESSVLELLSRIKKLN
jgi:hypothetical protein